MSPLVTLLDIADLVIEKLPFESQANIAGMQEDELIDLHFGLGTWIRNNFLWHALGSDVLVDRHPDDVSVDIIKLVWKRLNRELKPIINIDEKKTR